MTFYRKSKTTPLSYIIKSFLIAFTFLSLVNHAEAADVSFSWLPNSERSLAGYKIYYGPQARSYLVSVDVGKPRPVNNTIKATLTKLTPGTTYYFAATAYDTDGAESQFSQEIIWTAPKTAGTEFSDNADTDGSVGTGSEDGLDSALGSTVIEKSIKKSRLNFSPNILTYFCAPRSGTASQDLRVKDTGTGPISYTVDSDDNWLTFTHNFKASTSKYHVITVDYDINSLSAGVHTSIITVKIVGDDNPPLEIPVVVVIGDKAPVFNLWSEQYQIYFSAIQGDEIDYIANNYSRHTWEYENIAWFAYTEEDPPRKASPVYRFWSDIQATHFYTISETEKNFILSEYAEAEWRFEGIAYYAYLEGDEPADAKPVYRFWSTERQSHFYTISETKKDYIIDNYSEDEWRFEGVAWYAFDEPY